MTSNNEFLRWDVGRIRTPLQSTLDNLAGDVRRGQNMSREGHRRPRLGDHESQFKKQLVHGASCNSEGQKYATSSIDFNCVNSPSNRAKKEG
jgi:hypothetical protein